MLMNFDTPSWIREQAIEKKRLITSYVTSQAFIDSISKSEDKKEKTIGKQKN